MKLRCNVYFKLLSRGGELIIIMSSFYDVIELEIV